MALSRSLVRRRAGETRRGGEGESVWRRRVIMRNKNMINGNKTDFEGEE